MGKQWSSQYARFMLSGALVVLLNFSVYAGLVSLGLPYLLANAAAFVICDTTEYFVNRFFVFVNNPSESKHRNPSYVRFVLVSLGVILLSSSLLALFVESGFVLLFFPWVSPFQERIVAKVPTMIMVSVVDFVVKKFWVFEVRK